MGGAGSAEADGGGQEGGGGGGGGGNNGARHTQPHPSQHQQPAEKYRALLQKGGGAAQTVSTSGGGGGGGGGGVNTGTRDRLRKQVDDARAAADHGQQQQSPAQQPRAARRSKGAQSVGDESTASQGNGSVASGAAPTRRQASNASHRSHGPRSRKTTPEDMAMRAQGNGGAVEPLNRRKWTPEQIAPPGRVDPRSNRSVGSGGSSGVPPMHDGPRQTSSPDAGRGLIPRCSSAPSSREGSAGDGGGGGGGGGVKRNSPHLRHRMAIHDAHHSSSGTEGYEAIDIGAPNTPPPTSPPTSTLFRDDSGDSSTAQPSQGVATATPQERSVETGRKKIRRIKPKGNGEPRDKEELLNDTVSAFQSTLTGQNANLPINYMTFTLADDEPGELGYTDDDYRYAQWIGMDLDAHPHLLHIARKGLRAGVPEPWLPSRMDGKVVYENTDTGEVSENHPLDDFFRNWYAAAVRGEEYMCVEDYIMTVLRPAALSQIQISTSIVQFVDVTSGAVIKMKASDKGLRYAVNNQPRPLVRKVIYDPKTKIMRFPELHKGATLPSSHCEELATAIRRLCHLGGVENNFPAPAAAQAGGANARPTERPTFDRPGGDGGGSSHNNTSILPAGSPMYSQQGSGRGSPVPGSPQYLQASTGTLLPQPLSPGLVSPSASAARSFVTPALKKKRRKKGGSTEVPSAADFTSCTPEGVNGNVGGLVSPKHPQATASDPAPSATTKSGEEHEQTWVDSGDFSPVDGDSDEKDPVFPPNFPSEEAGGDASPAPAPAGDEPTSPMEESQADVDRTAEEVLYQRFIAEVERNGISESEVLQHGNFSDQDVDEMTRDLGFNVMERYKIKGRIDLKRMEIVAEKKNQEIEANMLTPPTDFNAVEDSPPARAEDEEYNQEADENTDILMELGGENIPEDYICNITGEIMIEPASTTDGHVYERSAIQAWLFSHDTSPNTNQVLENKSLVPNLALRRLIRNWREGVLKGMRMQASSDAAAAAELRPRSQSSSSRLLRANLPSPPAQPLDAVDGGGGGDEVGSPPVIATSPGAPASVLSSPSADSHGPLPAAAVARKCVSDDGSEVPELVPPPLAPNGGEAGDAPAPAAAAPPALMGGGDGEGVGGADGDDDDVFDVAGPHRSG